MAAGVAAIYTPETSRGPTRGVLTSARTGLREYAPAAEIAPSDPNRARKYAARVSHWIANTPRSGGKRAPDVGADRGTIRLIGAAGSFLGV